MGYHWVLRGGKERVEEDGESRVQASGCLLKPEYGIQHIHTLTHNAFEHSTRNTQLTGKKGQAHTATLIYEEYNKNYGFVISSRFDLISHVSIPSNPPSSSSPSQFFQSIQRWVCGVGGGGRFFIIFKGSRVPQRFY